MRKKSQHQIYLWVGLFLILFGIALIVFRVYLLSFLTQIIALIVILAAFFHLVRGLTGRNNISTPQDVFGLIASAGVAILISLWIIHDKSARIDIIGNIVGIYLFLACIINFVSAMLLIKNQASTRYWRLFYAIFHGILGIFAFRLSTEHSGILFVMGAYIFAIGLTYISDLFDSERMSKIFRRLFKQNGKKDFARKRRFSIPLIFHVGKPLQLLRKFKRKFKGKNKDDWVNIETPKMTADLLQIIFTTSEHNLDILGHIGFAYKNVVYNYGNHDVDSRYLFDSIGDGVLCLIDKDKYTRFTLAKGTTIIEYDLPLNSAQQISLEKKIASMRKDLVPWMIETETQRNCYGNELREKAQAELNKFCRGKFRNYFVFGTNCVLLTDEIIGSIGLDSFPYAMFLSPGTYLDFFEKAYNNGASWISDRRVLYTGPTKE